MTRLIGCIGYDVTVGFTGIDEGIDEGSDEGTTNHALLQMQVR